MAHTSINFKTLPIVDLADKLSDAFEKIWGMFLSNPKEFNIYLNRNGERLCVEMQTIDNKLVFRIVPNKDIDLDDDNYLDEVLKNITIARSKSPIYIWCFGSHLLYQTYSHHYFNGISTGLLHKRNALSYRMYVLLEAKSRKLLFKTILENVSFKTRKYILIALLRYERSNPNNSHAVVRLWNELERRINFMFNLRTQGDSDPFESRLKISAKAKDDFLRKVEKKEHEIRKLAGF
jgi:hypothetical protein